MSDTECVMGMCAWVYLFTCRAWRGCPATLELELQVNHLIWVLGGELGSSERAVWALNHWAILPTSDDSLRQGLSVEPRPCPMDVLVGQIIQRTPFPPLSARISGEWPQPLSPWWVPRIHTQAQLLSTEPPPKSLDVSNLKSKHSGVIQPKGIPIWYLLCNDDKQMSEVVCSFRH